MGEVVALTTPPAASHRSSSSTAIVAPCTRAAHYFPLHLNLSRLVRETTGTTRAEPVCHKKHGVWRRYSRIR